MDERTANLALRAMAHRMPHADVDALTPVVTRAWNTGYGGSPPWAAAMRAVVRRDLRPGIPARRGGRRRLHRRICHPRSGRHPRSAHRSRERPSRRGAHHGHHRPGGNGSQPDPTHRAQPGPSRADYDVALGDYNDESQPGRAAAAARTGWSHGRAQGNADTAWSLIATIRQAVTREVGELALRRVEVEGRSAREWLNLLDAKARYSAEAVEVSSIRSTQSVIHDFSVPDTAAVSQRQAAASNGLTAAQLAGQDQAPGVAAAPAGSAPSRRRPSSTTTTSTTRRRR